MGKCMCVTHSDMDGLFSAAVVKLKYPKARVLTTNYHLDCNLSMLRPGDTLFITDFSFPLAKMQYLDAEYETIWIDHHECVVQYMQQGFNPPNGIRSVLHSGAYLTWKYLFPDKPVPRVLELVSDYDTWSLKDPDSIHLHNAIQLVGCTTSYQSIHFMQTLMFNDYVLQRILSEGKPITEYLSKLHKILSDDMAYKTKVNGIDSWACNFGANSLIFEHCDKTNIPLMAKYYYNTSAKGYRISMYIDGDEGALKRHGLQTIYETTDPSIKDEYYRHISAYEECKRHGGGGHRGAAGCSVFGDKLPWEVPLPQQVDYTDIYAPLREMMEKSAIIRRFVTRPSPLQMAQAYPTSLCDYTAVAINDVMICWDGFYNSNLNYAYDVAIQSCFTNKGMFRHRIISLNPKLNEDELLDKLKEAYLHVQKVGQEIWVYDNELLKPIAEYV